MESNIIWRPQPKQVEFMTRTEDEVLYGGAAGGGYYLVTTYELDRTSSSTGTEILSQGKVDWLVGEEIR